MLCSMGLGRGFDEALAKEDAERYLTDVALGCNEFFSKTEITPWFYLRSVPPERKGPTLRELTAAIAELHRITDPRLLARARGCTCPPSTDPRHA
jgi:hypothetical protein